MISQPAEASHVESNAVDKDALDPKRKIDFTSQLSAPKFEALATGV